MGGCTGVQKGQGREKETERGSSCRIQNTEPGRLHVSYEAADLDRILTWAGAERAVSELGGAHQNRAQDSG